MRKRTALGAAAAFLVVAALVGAFVGAADLNPLATAAAVLTAPLIESVYAARVNVSTGRDGRPVVAPVRRPPQELHGQP